MAERNYIAFDFDHTIYRGDCTIDFCRFVMTRRPALLRYLPLQLMHAVLWKLSLVSTDEFKERFFCFLAGIDPAERDILVRGFWNSRVAGKFMHPVNDVLKQRLREGHPCVVITASPQWLVAPLASLLYRCECIGTLLEYDGASYRLVGKNCKGPEKTARFETVYGTDAVIEEAYSDNASDVHLFAKAVHAFKVSKKGIRPIK